MNWLEQFESKFSDSLEAKREVVDDEWEFRIKASSFVQALSWLKDEAKFNHLADLTAYDEKIHNMRFHVVYELISMQKKLRCRVLVSLPEEAAEIESIVKLWSGANWLEREIYDLYGIRFTNHPDLRRILLPPSFKGHPLRKDFVVDYRQEFPKSLSQETFDPFSSTIVDRKEVD